MSQELRLRRGSTVAHSVFTGANGEVTVDTEKKTIVVHDGETVGGNPLATYSDLIELSTDVQSTLSTRLRNSLADLLTEEEIAEIKDGTSTLDLSPKIQELIDLRQPFDLIPGGTHLCKSPLIWKSGASVYGESVPGGIPDNDLSGTETIILFDNELTDTGIVFAATANKWTANFEIIGVVITTTNPQLAWTNFTAIKTVPTGKGVYNFRLKDVSIRHVKFGFFVDNNFFTFKMENVAVQYAYTGFHKTSNGATTSGTFDWLKLTSCFHGVNMSDVVYTHMNVYYDHCGLSMFAHDIPGTSLLDAMPSDEMPILQRFNIVLGLTGNVGMEFSNAVFTRSEGYSQVEQNITILTDIQNTWYKNASRTANLALDQQAFFSVPAGFITVNNLSHIQRVSNGWPAASTSDPSYFTRLGSNAVDSRIIFNNCYIELENYCVYPAGTLGSFSADGSKNSRFIFGAENISRFRADADIASSFISEFRRLVLVPGSVETTVKTLPARRATYLVSAAIPAEGAVAMNAFAIISTSGTTSRVVFLSDATFLKITASGLNVNVTQTANPAGADVEVSLTRVS